MPPPTPSIYCSKKSVPEFFSQINNMSNPSRGKKKMKNQNYVTLALGLVQARWRPVPGFGFVNSSSCGSDSSLDFASDLFSKFITNGPGAKEPDAAKYRNNPTILPWNKGRSPKANLHQTWYIHHLK